MVWFTSILMGAIYALAGVFVKHYPELLSGYNTMSAERKKFVDIAALGRFSTRLLYIVAGLSLMGPPAWLLGADETIAVGLTVFIPIPVLLVGWLWGWWKYDAKLHKLEKNKKQ